MSSSHEQRDTYELISTLAMLALHVRADHVALGYLEQIATVINDIHDTTNAASEIEGLSFSLLIGIKDLRTAALERNGVLELESVIKSAKWCIR